jgi:hypothetical protein
VFIIRNLSMKRIARSRHREGLPTCCVSQPRGSSRLSSAPTAIRFDYRSRLGFPRFSCGFRNSSGRGLEQTFPPAPFHLGEGH